MKRICLLGAAIAAVFVIGVASALAATSHASKGGKKSKTPSTVTTSVSCTSSLSLQVELVGPRLAFDARAWRAFAARIKGKHSLPSPSTSAHPIRALPSSGAPFAFAR